jgi:TolB protein
VRLARTVAAALTLITIAGCGAAASSTGRRTREAAAAPAVTSATTSSARVVAAAIRGHGELAYVAHGKLFLLGGPAGGLKRIALPGVPDAPAWSADRRWLAVEVSKPAPASQPYLQEPTALWLVSSSGGTVRRLTPRSWQVTGYAWAPRGDRLAVAAYLPGAPQRRDSLAAIAGPGSAPRVLATGGYLSGPAWSPDGRYLAVGIGAYARGHWHSEVQVLSPAGGRPAVLTSSPANTLEVADWWPDGSGVLYWTDPQGSGSIAADGLPLSSVTADGPAAGAAATPRTVIPAMLVHGSWLALSPRGTVAGVSGGNRVIWSGGKHIVLCAAPGRCTPLAQPRGVVSLDPAWSPDGSRVAFARLSASGPFGPTGRADFSAAWISRWEATSRIWVASANGSGARPLAAAGRGAVDPTWGSDGSLLFVRDDSLWLLPAGASVSTRLTGALGALAGPAYYRTYYGYVPYPELSAWTLGPQRITAAGSGPAPYGQ